MKRLNNLINIFILFFISFDIKSKQIILTYDLMYRQFYKIQYKQYKNVVKKPIFLTEFYFN